MTSNVIHIDEEDVVRIIIQFLEASGLQESAYTLELESGITSVNTSNWPETALKLRTILERGHWSEAIRFVWTVQHLSEDEMREACYHISKQKYLELICIYQDLKKELGEGLRDAVEACFSELAVYCKNLEDLENLQKLVTLKRLEDDPQYTDWNSVNSRKDCFHRIWRIMKSDLANQIESSKPKLSSERLSVLLAKGVLYESCEAYCKQKALVRSTKETVFEFGSLTEGPSYDLTHFEGESQHYLNPVAKVNDRENYFINLDCSFFSWLKTIPWICMAKDFVRCPLALDVTKMVPRTNRWTETILQGANVKFENCVDCLKGPFLAGRISNNPTADAPEILKRAEEVVKRSEEKGRMHCVRMHTASPAITQIDDSLKEVGSRKISDEAICVAPYKGQLTVWGLESHKSCSGCLHSEVEEVMQDKVLRLDRNCDVNSKQNASLKDGSLLSQSKMQAEKWSTKNVKLLEEKRPPKEKTEGKNLRTENGPRSTPLSSNEMGDRLESFDDDDLRHVSIPGKGTESTNNVIEFRELGEMRDVSSNTDFQSIDFVDEYHDFCSEKDSCVGKIFTEDFSERKKYIVQLLKSKEQLRGNLLHILIGKKDQDAK